MPVPMIVALTLSLTPLLAAAIGTPLTAAAIGAVRIAIENR